MNNCSRLTSLAAPIWSRSRLALSTRSAPMISPMSSVGAAFLSSWAGRTLSFTRRKPENIASAVAVGEGEAIWSRMLEDAVHGRLNRIYRADLLPDLAGLPLPRYDLLNLRPLWSVQDFRRGFLAGLPLSLRFLLRAAAVGRHLSLPASAGSHRGGQALPLSQHPVWRQQFRRQAESRDGTDGGADSPARCAGRRSGPPISAMTTSSWTWLSAAACCTSISASKASTPTRSGA